MKAQTFYLGASAAVLSVVLLVTSVYPQPSRRGSNVELEQWNQQNGQWNGNNQPSMIYFRGGERGIGPYYYTEEDDPTYRNFVVADNQDQRPGIKTLPTISNEYMRGYQQVHLRVLAYETPAYKSTLYMWTVVRKSQAKRRIEGTFLA
jgi:hypothetical protein